MKLFFIRRTLRIFPAYYFLLLVYFILTLFHVIEISNASWLTSLTYTKYFNWDLDWYTAHAWSLSIEEQFYLFWPIVFIAGKKARLYCLIFIIAVIPPFRVYNFFHPMPWVNSLTIFMRLDSIATGCLCAIYQEQIIDKLKHYWKTIFYCSIVLIFLLGSLIQLNTIYNLHLSFFLILPFDSTIANVLIAAIMMFSMFGNKGFWYKFLNLKLLNYIGLLSYSIYLWQQFFLTKNEYWTNQFPQNILFIFMASLFSFYLVEKPFLKMKQKFQFMRKE